MDRWKNLILTLAAGLLTNACAHAASVGDSDCGRFRGCTYEGAPFRFTVVDAETQKPLADVHALAEWVLEGYHGVNGPLMVQDAVSGPDGVVVFPPWGPLSGPASGLVRQQDPAITLFKPGYRTLFVYNEYHELGLTQVTRVRKFDRGRQDIALQPFRGTPEAWVQELDKAVWPPTTGRTSSEQLLLFRIPYLNRYRRVLAERGNVPERFLRPGQTFWHLERSIKSLEEGGR